MPRAPAVGILRSLGIVGYRRLEPVVLAALALEAPLLIVGPHGTAKSLLLNRLAGALGVVHRHYNASTVNFDDLVGYPYPDDERRSIRFIPTPSSIWGAESVFVDEISRCRVDLQNRLFPIIHERMLQGVPLEGLRYRFAAMNPPFDADADLHDDLASRDDAGAIGYRGSEPLDLALADRFPFVIEAPALADLSESDLAAVITGAGAEVDPGAGQALRERLDAMRRLGPLLRAERGAALTTYVQTVLPRLGRFALAPSPRRAAMLFEGALAIEAARASAGETDPSDAWYLALRYGLPDAALGRPLDEAKLLALHKHAFALAGVPASDPRRLLEAEQDPARRAAFALRLRLPADATCAYLLEAVGRLDLAERYAFAAAFHPVVSRVPDLPAVAYEALATLYAELARPDTRRHTIPAGTPRWRSWQGIVAFLGSLADDDPDGPLLVNLCQVLFERNVSMDPEAIAERYRSYRGLARGVEAALARRPS